MLLIPLMLCYGRFPRVPLAACIPEELDEEPDNEESQKEEEMQPLAVNPYVSGVSEQIRKACEKYNFKVVFKSGLTLRSLLTKVKNPLPKEKLAGVVYQIPCQCGKVYVGETQRRLEM